MNVWFTEKTNFRTAFASISRCVLNLLYSDISCSILAPYTCFTLTCCSVTRGNTRSKMRGWHTWQASSGCINGVLSQDSAAKPNEGENRLIYCTYIGSSKFALLSVFCKLASQSSERDRHHSLVKSHHICINLRKKLLEKVWLHVDTSPPSGDSPNYYCKYITFYTSSWFLR